jgi:AcrR family transcriptional regulator
METTTPKSNEVQALESAIIKSAAKLFAQNGYHRSSMESIAQDAQISKAKLYSVCTNKEELILKVIEKIFTDMDKCVLEAAALNRDPIDRTKYFIEKELQYFKTNPESFIIILTERKLLKPEELEPYHKVALDRYLHHIHIMSKYLILPGIRMRELLNMGAQKMAFTLSGLVISTVWRQLLSEFIGVTPESLHREVDSIMKIFLDGVKRSGSKSRIS